MINRICFFDFIYNLGGGQRSTVDLLENVSDRFANVIIADAHGESEDFKEYASSRSIPLVVINPAKGTAIGKSSKISRMFLLAKYIPSYLKTVLLLGKFVKKSNIEFIWTNTFKGLVALMIATNSRFVSRGLFIRAGGMLDKITAGQLWMLKNGVSHIMVQSNIIKQKLIDLGVNPIKISIISNTISDMNSMIGRDSLNSLAIRENCLNVLIPATIIREKGIKEAILAIKIFKENFGSSISLYLAGKDGNFGKNTSPFAESLKQIIFDNNLENDVYFLGLRNDLISIMSNIDIVLLPSYAEGMPRSIMEGMALGKAVVGTKVGAVPELIEDNVNGILVEPKSAEQIADALGRLRDIEIRTRLGKNAKGFIYSRYSKQSQAEQFDSFINKIS